MGPCDRKSSRNSSGGKQILDQLLLIVLDWLKIVQPYPTQDINRSKDRWAHRRAAIDLANQELQAMKDVEAEETDLLDLVYLHALNTIAMPNHLGWPNHEAALAADEAIQPVYEAIVSLSDMGDKEYACDKHADDTHLDRIVDGQFARASQFVINNWEKIETLAAGHSLRDYAGFPPVTTDVPSFEEAVQMIIELDEVCGNYCSREKAIAQWNSMDFGERRDMVAYHKNLCTRTLH